MSKAMSPHLQTNEARSSPSNFQDLLSSKANAINYAVNADSDLGEGLLVRLLYLQTSRDHPLRFREAQRLMFRN